MKKTWTVTLDDIPHTIELEHGFWSGWRTITVDGRQVHRSRQIVDFGSSTPVKIGAHQLSVVVGTNGITFNYDLAVDGASHTSGKPVAVSGQRRLPSWGWMFVAACALVPVVTLGGAIPAAIGVGGVIAVSNTATNPVLSDRDRVLRCLSATVVTWAALALFILVFRGLLAGR